ncbi:MAG TPA: hypothetical protein VGC99_00255 [Candidatus Tectomicrobia bacterium]
MIVLVHLFEGICKNPQYANPQTRLIFTPMDLIQFLSQGFLWPSAWPTLADTFGIDEVIQPPQTTSWVAYLAQVLGRIVLL